MQFHGKQTLISVAAGGSPCPRAWRCELHINVKVEASRCLDASSVLSDKSSGLRSSGRWKGEVVVAVCMEGDKAGALSQEMRRWEWGCVSGGSIVVRERCCCRCSCCAFVTPGARRVGAARAADLLSDRFRKVDRICTSLLGFWFVSKDGKQIDLCCCCFSCLICALFLVQITNVAKLIPLISKKHNFAIWCFH